MPQRPLDEVEIARLFIQPGGESVAERVQSGRSVDARVFKPLGEPQLDLPATQSSARLTPKKRRVWCTFARVPFSLRNRRMSRLSPRFRNTRSSVPPFSLMRRVPVLRSMSPTCGATSDPSQMPVPRSNSKTSRSRSAKGPPISAKTDGVVESLICPKWRVPSRPPVTTESVGQDFP